MRYLLTDEKKEALEASILFLLLRDNNVVDVDNRQSHYNLNWSTDYFRLPANAENSNVKLTLLKLILLSISDDTSKLKDISFEGGLINLNINKTRNDLIDFLLNKYTVHVATVLENFTHDIRLISQQKKFDSDKYKLIKIVEVKPVTSCFRCEKCANNNVCEENKKNGICTDCVKYKKYIIEFKDWKIALAIIELWKKDKTIFSEIDLETQIERFGNSMRPIDIHHEEERFFRLGKMVIIDILIRIEHVRDSSEYKGLQAAIGKEKTIEYLFIIYEFLLIFSANTKPISLVMDIDKILKYTLTTNNTITKESKKLEQKVFKQTLLKGINQRIFQVVIRYLEIGDLPIYEVEDLLKDEDKQKKRKKYTYNKKDENKRIRSRAYEARIRFNKSFQQSYKPDEPNYEVLFKTTKSKEGANESCWKINPDFCEYYLNHLSC